jgi:hypothetical protein
MAGTFDALLAATRHFLKGLDEQAWSFVGAIDWQMPERPLGPKTLPVVGEMPRCVELATDMTHPLVECLAGNSESLHWGQTYTQADFGKTFMRSYGWVELFGTRGHFANDSIAGGFLLLGPGLTYPDHHHIAEEIYVPLTGGADWRKGDGPFVTRSAGDVIHHPSNVNHAMRTGDEPLLALYLWRGGPLAQKSVIGR